MIDENGNSGAAGPAMVLLSGLPGAGKTTFARALTEAVQAVHVESDGLRRAMFATPRYSSWENAAVFAAVERAAAEALGAGRVAVVDATNLTRRDRVRFVRLAANDGRRLVCVRVTAADEVIRARLTAPREGNSQADLRVYALMRSKAQSFLGPVVVVDTRYDVHPSVALVGRLLKEPHY